MVQKHQTDWIPFLTELAKIGDNIALPLFKSSSLKVNHKHDLTPVTQADIDIEKKIREVAGEQFPELGVVGEEFGDTMKDADIKLIVDPIDGTRNFIRGLPFFASLLAIEEKGEVIAGMVSAPATGERWWAAKGKGSMYNGQPISVSTISTLKDAQAFHGSLYGCEASKKPEGVLNLLKQTARQRGMGDYYAHMLVAMGCGECAIDFNLKVWDMAPLKIIVEEAGGKLTDVTGKNSIYNGNVVSSNLVIHDAVLQALKN
ncbi:MAG: histidinol-phosphatase [Candidatus Margulisbacteria bacterium]|nr:histidinol-phosphatase [Candidatus Margulisiibacteriota bacterium]